MALVLVVPGRCEKSFLRTVLAREFSGIVSTIIDSDGDSKVIKDAVRIRRRLEPENSTPIFVRDLDDFACRSALKGAFDPTIPPGDIVIAYRCLEAWYLADVEAINRQFSRLPKAFRARPDADSWPDPQEEIKRLLQANGNPKGRHYYKTDFATSFAQHFSLRRAAMRSSSAKRLVARIEAG